MATIVPMAKAYIDNMLLAVQENLPSGSAIEWNGHSYTVKTSLPSEELSRMLDRVSRTFWEKSSPVFQARPKSWRTTSSFVILSEPMSDGKGGFLPTFIAGASYGALGVSKGLSLAKYTWFDRQILRRDDLAERLQASLGAGSEILWNGHSYTVKTPGDPDKILSTIFGVLRTLDARPISINSEKIIDPEGNIKLGLVFYEEMILDVEDYAGGFL